MNLLLTFLMEKLEAQNIQCFERNDNVDGFKVGEKISVISFRDIVMGRIIEINIGTDNNFRFCSTEEALEFIINAVEDEYENAEDYNDYNDYDYEEDYDYTDNYNYDQEQIGHFTTLIKLKNIKNNVERMKVYSDILISNIGSLSSKRQQYVVINEKGNGGIIYGYRKNGKDYESKLFIMLQEANPGKDIETLGVTCSKEGEYYKRGFVIKDKKKAKMTI